MAHNDNDNDDDDDGNSLHTLQFLSHIHSPAVVPDRGTRVFYAWSPTAMTWRFANMIHPIYIPLSERPHYMWHSLYCQPYMAGSAAEAGFIFRPRTSCVRKKRVALISTISLVIFLVRWALGLCYCQINVFISFCFYFFFTAVSSRPLKRSQPNFPGRQQTATGL